MMPLFVGGQKSRFGGPICFYCGERGHVKRICPELRMKNEELCKKEEEDKSRKGPEIANFSHHGRFNSKGNVSSDFRWSLNVTKIFSVAPAETV